jgi:hypothetical protein
MGATSIYPIRQLYFQCDGCKAQWMLRAEPPIHDVDGFKAFTSDPKRMESCPRKCGATTCSIAFRLGEPPTDATERADPFSMFDGPRDPRKEP